MYIAPNRFQILPGKEMHFEKIWRGRDSKLASVPGFKTFNLIRGDSTGDYTLYACIQLGIQKMTLLRGQSQSPFVKPIKTPAAAITSFQVALSLKDLKS